MAIYNSANLNYQSFNKTLFEATTLALSNGHIVDSNNPLPVVGLSANSISSAPFEWQVALGTIPNATQVNIFGYSANIATTYSIAWENAPTEYAYITTPQTLSVNSTSSSDNSNAKVLITGLDGSWAPLSEVVTLNGTSVVTTTLIYSGLTNIGLTLATALNLIFCAIASCSAIVK